jgi:hypothetical protein
MLNPGINGFGGFGGTSSLNGWARPVSYSPFSGGIGTVPTGGSDPMSSMMGMMMSLMTQNMLGTLLGKGGVLSPLGSAGLNPAFGKAGRKSLGAIGRNFLGASPSAKAARAGKGGSSNSPGVRGLLKKAGSMVGLHERRDRDKIKKITGKSGIDPATTPWCAAFAMNLIKDFGLDDLKGLSNRNYCPTIESWARGKGKYGTPGKYRPKPGDAILFDWSGGKGTPDHIGIVEKVANGKVYTIEGNSSDSVKRKVYPLNSAVIDGYVITGKKKK